MSSAEPIDLRDYLTLDECASRMRVGIETMRRYTRSGELKNIRIGKPRYVKPVDLDEFIAERARKNALRKAVKKANKRR